MKVQRLPNSSVPRSWLFRVHILELQHVTKLHTNLQPISLIRVTTPCVESSIASTRTLKRWSSELESVRDFVSKGASASQLEYELRTKTKEEREAILHTAMGTATSITIKADDVLAMKADLTITWNKLRDIRR